MKDAKRFLEHCATELFFRRFKSLAQLGHLPEQDDESAKAWLYGKLLVALLVEKLIGHALAVSPWGAAWRRTRPPSAWRDFKFMLNQVVQAVEPGLPLHQVRAEWNEISKNLANPPLRRIAEWDFYANRT